MVNEVLGPPARESVSQSRSVLVTLRSFKHGPPVSANSAFHPSVSEYQALHGRLVVND